MPVTKNQIYTKLIWKGRERGFDIIPEFRILPDNRNNFKAIDLVWVQQLQPALPERPNNFGFYQIIAAFEIDGLDVPYARFDEHWNNYNTIYNVQGKLGIGMTIIFDDAPDRPNWPINDLHNENRLVRYQNRETAFTESGQPHQGLNVHIVNGNEFINDDFEIHLNNLENI